MSPVTGRFAPSPSGRMHLGNVYAALLSWLSARKQGGSWLLRIEDLDRQRCRREYADLLMDDLTWLGLEWDNRDVPFQSGRDGLYEKTLSALEEQGLVYDCFCRRTDLLSASAPHASDGTPVYSGRCRGLSPSERARLGSERKAARRLYVGEGSSFFTDGHYGLQRCDMQRDVGDCIVRRADGNFSYQLAVVADDAAMGVTEVVRGRDLLPSAHVQRYLYSLLGVEPPCYCHLPLLVGPDGRRLSKRDKDIDMGFLRSACTQQGLVGHIMHLCGFIEQEQPLSLEEALALFSWERLPRADIEVENLQKSAD